MFRPFRAVLTFAVSAVALLAGAPAPAGAAEVNVYTTREPGLIQPLLAAFTEATGTTVNTVFQQAGLADRVLAEGRNSPADLLMTVDIGNLLDLVRRDLAQPVRSTALDAAVPPPFRDPEGRWYALTLRARAILASKDRVGDVPRSYADLADPRFKGRVCVRSGNHPYNVSLFAAMLAKSGEAATTEFLTGLKANLAKAAGLFNAPLSQAARTIAALQAKAEADPSVLAAGAPAAETAEQAPADEAPAAESDTENVETDVTEG